MRGDEPRIRTEPDPTRPYQTRPNRSGSGFGGAEHQPVKLRLRKARPIGDGQNVAIEAESREQEIGSRNTAAGLAPRSTGPG